MRKESKKNPQLVKVKSKINLQLIKVKSINMI
jgi:hypothetical protein